MHNSILQQDAHYVSLTCSQQSPQDVHVSHGGSLGSEDVGGCAQWRDVLRWGTGLGADHHDAFRVEDVALGADSASLIPPCENDD